MNKNILYTFVFLCALAGCKAPILKDNGGVILSSSRETVPKWLKGFQDEDSDFFYFYVQKESNEEKEPLLKNNLKIKLKDYFIKRILDIVQEGNVKISQAKANAYLAKMPNYVLENFDKDLFYWRKIQDDARIFFDHYYVLRISKENLNKEELRILKSQLK